MPRVSVIVPVRNAVRTIGRTIDGVLSQTYGDLELIVVDNGSTDGTREAIAAYDGRITVVEERRAGPSVARNAGARAAKGVYLAFVDADDVWMPSMLDRCVPALATDRTCVLKYADIATVDAEG